MIGRYIIHPSHRYLEEIVSGTVTLPEMKNFLLEAMADPAWDPEFNVLVDLTEAQIDISFDEMSNLTGMLRNDARASRGYCALIVSNTLGYGMARMFEALSDDRVTVQIFQDRQAAESWIRKATHLIRQDHA